MEHDQPHESGLVMGEGGGHEQHAVRGWDGQQRLMSGEMYNLDTSYCPAQVQLQPGQGAGEAGGDWWLLRERDNLGDPRD